MTRFVFTGSERTTLFETVPMEFAASIVPLIARRGDRAWPLGTAFTVTPKLDVVVTARHCFDCLDDVLGQLPPGYTPVAKVPIELFGLWPTSLADPVSRRATEITAFTTREGSDLAILSFNRSGIDPGIAQYMRGLPISTCEPTMGAWCTAIGFPDMSIGPGGPGAEAPWSAQMSCRVQASRGPVLDFYPTRRDTVSGPFPSFHVEMHCPGGMSGGPVLDSNGGVIGVVSRGFDVESNEPPTTFCASIAPLLTLPIPIGDSMEPLARSPHFQDLTVIGPSVTISDDEDGQTVTWMSNTEQS